MKLLSDEFTTRGAAVFTEAGGILSVCLDELDGEVPTMVFGLQIHERAMSASISIVDAALIARAIEVMVAKHLEPGTSP